MPAQVTGVLTGLHTLALHNIAAALRAMAARTRAIAPAPRPAEAPALPGAEAAGAKGREGSDGLVAELSARKLVKRRLQVAWSGWVDGGGLV